MKSGRYFQVVGRLVPCVMGLMALAPLACCHAGVPEGIVKHYEVNISLFSIQPDHVLDSYVWHGNGMAAPNSTVRLACRDELRDFSVQMQPHLKDDRLVAEIATIPGPSDTITQGQTLEIDLSTLEPKAIKLGRNDDGRTYLLNLMPTIKTADVTPRRADETAFEFNKWVFQGSIVVVNDRLYAGKISAAGGYKAFVDIAEVGKFEFAMQPFRDAKLLGTLKDGQIHIEGEEGTTVEIYDVKNGMYATQLPGGPYAIWVRQRPSTMTAEYTIPPEKEWIEQIKAQFAQIGQTSPSEEELHSRYEQFRSRGTPVMMASGLGPIPEADKVK